MSSTVEHEQPNQAEAEQGAQMRAVTRHLVYPPTPDLSTRLGQRADAAAPRWGSRRQRWAFALTLVGLIGMGCVAAVPSVRAAMPSLIQIGVVRIWPAPTPLSPPSTLPAPTRAELYSSPWPLLHEMGLTGQTSLAEARALVDFPIRLPAYPDGIGLPDEVYLQELGGPAVILIWLQPHEPPQVRYALFALSRDAYATKLGPTSVTQTRVNGKPALWVDGPYFVQLGAPHNQQLEEIGRLVSGHTLSWTIEEVTYRLEGEMEMDEAVKIAQSVQ